MFSNFIKRKLTSPSSVIVQRYYNSAQSYANNAKPSTSDANQQQQQKPFENERRLTANILKHGDDTNTNFEHLYLASVALGINIRTHFALLKKDAKADDGSSSDDETLEENKKKRKKCIFLNALCRFANVNPSLSVLPRSNAFGRGDKVFTTLTTATTGSQQSLSTQSSPSLPSSSPSTSSSNSSTSSSEITSSSERVRDVEISNEQIFSKDLIELQLIAQENKHEMINLLSMAYLEENKPAKAIRLLSKAKTSAKCMFNLGLIYELGKQSSARQQPDYANAVKYYETAARLGHRYAKYNLGLIYLHGKGQIKVNTEKGNELLRQAANLGVKEAENYINELKFKRLFTSLNFIDKRFNLNRQAFTSSTSAPDLISLQKV